MSKNKLKTKKQRLPAALFKFLEPQQLNLPIISLANVSFSYSTEELLFGEVYIDINLSSRIAILGSNGAGKSTFLQLLAGKHAIKGVYKKNPRVRIGLYNQHSWEHLTENESPTEYLIRLFNLTNEIARKWLGDFGLMKHVHLIKIKDLSGGQKARVALAELSLHRPDILLLDEPTNSLDMESIDALITAINKFKGGVVIVSHNERFIRETECDLYLLEDGTLERFDGDFEDYRRYVIQQVRSDL
jgi:ATP-binding cassette subfamily F protein 1